MARSDHQIWGFFFRQIQMIAPTSSGVDGLIRLLMDFVVPRVSFCLYKLEINIYIYIYLYTYNYIIRTRYSVRLPNGIEYWFQG